MLDNIMKFDIRYIYIYIRYLHTMECEIFPCNLGYGMSSEGAAIFLVNKSHCALMHIFANIQFNVYKFCYGNFVLCLSLYLLNVLLFPVE